jgi:hypothetical protein
VIPIKRVEEAIHISLHHSNEKLSASSVIPETDILAASGSRKKGYDCTY